jgi:hypothetical protein
MCNSRASRVASEHECPKSVAIRTWRDYNLDGSARGAISGGDALISAGGAEMNRRKMLGFLGLAPTLLAGAAEADKTKGKNKNGKAADGEPKVEALNPRGFPPAIQLVPMAPRLSSLDGKTIYLVGDGFPGADHFLAQIALWFKKNMPSVTTVYRLKAGALADDDPKLWAEVKAKGQAVIMAIGH